MYIVSFVIGLIIVISSIFLIRHEFNKAIRSQKLLLEQSKVYKGSDLFDLLESLQTSIDDMNRAFYEIAGDLEGKYSVHEKEIQILNEQSLRIQNIIEKSKVYNSQSQTDFREEKMRVENEYISDKSIKEHIERMSSIPASDSLQQKNGSTLSDHDLNTKDESALNDKIILLRSQGHSLPQIAKELGIGMGELQLLLNLKK